MRSTRAVAIAVLLFAVACGTVPSIRTQTFSDGRYVMGTVLEVTLDGRSRKAASETLVELFEVAERLDALMTVWDSGSQISQLNRAAGQGPQVVDPEVTELLQRSIGHAELTGGTFDVTVGPLVELWKDAAVDGSAPTPGELKRARARVGAAAIEVYPDGRVALAREGVRVDLGGIAKGFALDRMRPLLRERGVTRALVSFGQSSSLAIGTPPDAEGWRLLVRGPTAEVMGVITLTDEAFSVSSSFGHWVDIGGRRYGHVIDPRSGRPLTRAAQALIVAPDATLAEALSKALLILSPAEGIALVAATEDCEGMLLDADRKLHKTPGWDAATHWESPPFDDSSASAIAPIAEVWPNRI